MGYMDIFGEKGREGNLSKKREERVLMRKVKKGILIEKGEAKDKEWGKRIELYGEGMFWFNY